MKSEFFSFLFSLHWLSIKCIPNKRVRIENQFKRIQVVPHYDNNKIRYKFLVCIYQLLLLLLLLLHGVPLPTAIKG